ncbi:MAG: ABC transporter permease [Gammaproteobacteria bacterium]|nr:ABC transporter permease [Gammaproteobacteria bacterium]
MNLLVNIRIALDALRANKLRSFLTMLGIIIGVAAVITMVALGNGAERRVAEQIDALGTNILMIRSQSRGSAAVRTGAGQVNYLTEADANAIKAVPDVAAAAGSMFGRAQIIFGAENWNTQVLGVDHDYLRVRGWALESGRMFTPAEVQLSEKVALIGTTVANELFGLSDPVGQVVRVNRLPVTIIGVLAEKGQDMRGDDQDDTMIMPITTVRSKIVGRTYSLPNQVHTIMVSVTTSEAMEQVQEDIRQVLRKRQRLRPDEDDNFGIGNLSQFIEARAETQRIFNVMLSAVASVSLVVGGIGIMNIMLVSVTERTREIGLRVAIGATPGQIMQQFLVEAIVLCVLGGTVGILLALLATWAFSRLGDWPVFIDATVIAGSIVFSAGIGIAFGFLPARKAALLDPIEALRHE